MSDLSGFQGQGHNQEVMMKINMEADTGDVYDPDDWVWKWNNVNNPDTEAPIYVAYEKEKSAIIEKAF